MKELEKIDKVKIVRNDLNIKELKKRIIKYYNIKNKNELKSKISNKNVLDAKEMFVYIGYVFLCRSLSELGECYKYR